ncbi:MAG: signal peptidase II [Gammaproteobacteria bacterium]|nr:MAG: signal peptidase II [Gammaproteobacteria bacterium]RKZ67501.1 MAG: signal peptidase II [Gammaproteobacteria bacterium]
MANFPIRLEGLKWLWLTALIIIFDLWTKNLASQHLQMHDPVAVFTGFNLTLMHNTGAAFSFLGDAGGWQRWFFICLTLAVSTFIVIWLYGLKANQRWMACALALILGGALGNLWDRVTLGYVVDFIDVSLSFLPWRIFNPWPAFNVADSAITIGATMLIIDATWFSDKNA